MNLNKTIVLEIENCNGDTKMCVAIDFSKKTIITKNCSFADEGTENLFINSLPSTITTIRIQQDDEDMQELDRENYYDINHLIK